MTESFVYDSLSSRGSVSCRVVYMVHHAGFTAGWCATLRSTEDFPFKKKAVAFALTQAVVLEWARINCTGVCRKYGTEGENIFLCWCATSQACCVVGNGYHPTIPQRQWLDSITTVVWDWVWVPTPLHTGRICSTKIFF